MIKLDTQGSELSILSSGANALNNATMVEIEVEFTEIYAGQPLFHDVAKYMYDKGFELLYINRVFQNRKQYNGDARGQMIFGDALFGRRDDLLGDFDAVAVARYVILLAQYGYRDIAATILQNRPDVRSLIPNFERVLKGYEDDNTRAAHIAFDKTLCWQLHRRRTNQIPADGDRSWPIR
jgi:hypothetical protein